jgi:predicted phage-related endonuclease
MTLQHTFNINLPESALVAESQIESLVSRIKEIDATAHVLKKERESLAEQIKNYMDTADELYSQDGIVLATWKATKDSIDIDKKILKQEFPEIWELCSKFISGVKKFLIK